jgi:hypothetical protein
MSTYVGNDNSNEKIVHVTYSEAERTDMLNGPYADTKFHSSNPYINVAEYGICYRTSVWTNSIDPGGGCIIVDYTIPTNLATSLAAGKGYMPILKFASTYGAYNGANYYVGGFQEKPLVYSVSGSTLRLIGEVTNDYQGQLYLSTHFPAEVHLVTFDGTFTDFNQRLTGDMEISNNGIVVGGTNLTAKTFMSIREGQLGPLDGTEPSFIIAQKSRTSSAYLPDRYFTIDILNSAKLTNIDFLMNSGDISIGGKSVVTNSSRYWHLGQDLSLTNADGSHPNISVDPNNGNVTLHGIRIDISGLSMGDNDMLHVNLTGTCWHWGQPTYTEPHYDFAFNGLLPKWGNTDGYLGLNTSGGTAYTDNVLSYNLATDGNYLYLQLFHYSEDQPIGLEIETSPIIEHSGTMSFHALTGVIQVLEKPRIVESVSTAGGGNNLIVDQSGFTASITTIRSLVTASYPFDMDYVTGKYTSGNTAVHTSFSYGKFNVVLNGTATHFVSSEEDFDWLGIWLNGVQIVEHMGTRSGSFAVSVGDVVEVVYGKDASFSEGQDKATLIFS